MLSILLRSIQFIIWIIRHNDQDIVKLYNSLAPLIIRLTGSNMLNFGYWTENIGNPLEAQQNLCKLIADLSEFSDSNLLKVVDAGSGYSAPAKYWKSKYSFLDIICVNINYVQLKKTNTIDGNGSKAPLNDKLLHDSNLNKNSVTLVNSDAKLLPFASECIDRIIALESAQHFKPLNKFFTESKRVLKRNDGLLLLAIPIVNRKNEKNPDSVTKTNILSNLIKRIRNNLTLGILSLMWSSEHPQLNDVLDELKTNGFDVKDIHFIGNYVYEPLTEFYIKNRNRYKNIILSENPSFVKYLLYTILEYVYFRSALKMSNLSKRRIIDYAIIKARL